ncbi:hha toxicity modulator TomB [Rosenbergiella nectarea]|uniref:Hha toxicity modulator TomB n=2 Tax=Rosenbergiella nectarea TaxID=988801 RepID=A0A1H9IGT9_9GAMM|nr:hha toxicity modulator TomB [Rosenbergiella nectarea]
MDEYTPKYFDIAQLKYLCEKLYTECDLLLNENTQFAVNDPTATESLLLNDFIEHIANVGINYRIKYSQDTALIEALDQFLDHSSQLLGNYGVTPKEIKEWKQLSDTLFQYFNKTINKYE